MRSTPLILALTVMACSESTDADGLNLAGTWIGTLTLATAAGDFGAPATFALTQSGNTLAGTMSAPDDIPLLVSGSLSGSELTLVITPGQAVGDDCHLFSRTVHLTATATTLTATGASGELCDGDGNGGHESLVQVTGASGTFTRG